jgi:hypothetical protein
MIDKENILAAQCMYVQRIDVLQAEISKIVTRGMQLGEDYEEETMSALDVIEEELDGINECLTLLNGLLWS